MPVRRPSLGFTFDARTGRYRNVRTGRFIPRREVQRALEQVIAKSAQRITTLGAQLRNGTITVGDWETAMRAEVKTSHLVSTMVAKGGRVQLDAGDLAAVSDRVQKEFTYLRRFADQIASGEAALDGRFARRSEMYAKAARGTFHEVGREEEQARGFTYERNVIHPGDSCTGCLAATALGKVPIGALVPIGQRDCKSNCRCEIVYSRA